MAKDALKTYNAKRDFRISAEPRGKVARGKGSTLGYVVQKHDASHLHYDFRLEWNGVLLSWAVPKGPSYYPGNKRLAVRTEDHPVSYADFEGTIPENHYGAGTVMVWDRGSWEPLEEDVDAAIADGKLHFRLDGEKLQGEWALARMRTKDRERENWLLMKVTDGKAVAEDDEGFLEENDYSAKSGRAFSELCSGDKAGETGDMKEAGRKGKAKARSKSSKKENAETKKKDEKQRTNNPAPDDSEQVTAGVTVTHPGREIFPDAHISKGELADYYARMSAFILPGLEKRPLSLLRCPGGIEKKCFFQRAKGKGMPAHIHTIDISHEGRTHEYMYVKNARGLIELVQMGGVELHTWGVRIDNTEKPDRIVFDLDPDEEIAFESVRKAAREVRDRLDELGLRSFLKCTGGKGLHVTIPIERRHDWDSVKDFSRRLAQRMVDDSPGTYTGDMAKRKRKGRIFIDYLRNDFASTAVMDYCVRARPGAPVAVPLAWSELDELDAANAFSIRQVLERKADGRLFEYPTIRQSLNRDILRRV